MTEQAERFAVEDNVRITGHPVNFDWMDELVGKIGVIEEVNDDEPPEVYGVRFAGETSVLWFGPSFLEPVGRRETDR